MLRVALFPADETGCGAYRMRLPAAACPEVETLFPPGTRRTIREITEGELPVDVVVFQRPAHTDLVNSIPAIRAAGIAVVVELDDDLAACHPQSIFFEVLHPSNPVYNWRNLKRACQLADLVTVTTPGLAARYGGQKARVLPNYVASELLAITAERDGRTIGWGGFTGTHIGDLTVTHGGVAQAIVQTDSRFLAVGHPDGVRRDLGLSDDPDSTGPVPFAEYHQTLAQLDVTIAPLDDTQFNRSKSGLKVLEAAALGIPCVASPRPEYERLAAEGLCVLADDRARAWRRECKALLADPALRAERGAEARAVIAAGHTYELNGWRWAECWDEAAVRSRRRYPKPILEAA